MCHSRKLNAGGGAWARGGQRWRFDDRKTILSVTAVYNLSVDTISYMGCESEWDMLPCAVDTDVVWRRRLCVSLRKFIRRCEASAECIMLETCPSVLPSVRSHNSVSSYRILLKFAEVLCFINISRCFFLFCKFPKITPPQPPFNNNWNPIRK